MGRARIATNILEARGAFKKNAKRKDIRANEPSDHDEFKTPPPKYFSAEEKAAFKEIIKFVPKGVLVKSDTLHVELAARLLAEFRRDGTVDRVITYGDKPDKIVLYKMAVRLSVHVDRYGRRSLKRSKTPLAFGHRESNNKTSSPKNMQSFINSFLMEEKMVVVVNGTHPTFHPVYRRDGEIVRVGGKVKGVGRATHAILQRMNDDRIDKYYPDESRLYSKNIGTRYAQKGIRRAKPKVMNYLIYAYGEALKRIERKNSKQKTVIYA